MLLLDYWKLIATTVIFCLCLNISSARIRQIKISSKQLRQSIQSNSTDPWLFRLRPEQKTKFIATPSSKKSFGRILLLQYFYFKCKLTCPTFPKSTIQLHPVLVRLLWNYISTLWFKTHFFIKICYCMIKLNQM